MTETQKLQGVESIRAQADGTFIMKYQGQTVQLVPNFTVTTTTLEKYQQVFPSVRLKTANVLEYQVQQGQRLLTTDVTFAQ